MNIRPKASSAVQNKEFMSSCFAEQLYCHIILWHIHIGLQVTKSKRQEKCHSHTRANEITVAEPYE